MCILIPHVEQVSDTNIFARMGDGGDTQFLVYQMKFQTNTPTAMILPLPVASREDSAVRWIDLSGYDDFFKDMNAPFEAKSRSAVDTLGFDAKRSFSLAVHDVGDFEASFVPHQSEFHRLDPRFQLRPEILAQMPEYADYGFAVFQLKNLGGKPHPIAFEFDTAEPTQLYFPAKHLHDGQLHEYDDFDHSLFFQVQEGGFSPRQFVNSLGKAEHYMNIEKAQGVVWGHRVFYRHLLKGQWRNQDIWLSLPAGATTVAAVA